MTNAEIATALGLRLNDGNSRRGDFFGENYHGHGMRLDKSTIALTSGLEGECVCKKALMFADEVETTEAYALDFCGMIFGFDLGRATWVDILSCMWDLASDRVMTVEEQVEVQDIARTYGYAIGNKDTITFNGDVIAQIVPLTID